MNFTITRTATALLSPLSCRRRDQQPPLQEENRCSEQLSRRNLLAGLGAAGLSAAAVLAARTPALAAAHAEMTVHHDPSCGCCGAWVKHVQDAGFSVSVREAADLAAIKARLGVPPQLASCHTAEVAGYVIEGHVPAAAIRRLLAERPQAKGLAVPGMPIGSPGMEMEGTAPDVYDVMLFAPIGAKTFARYRGSQAI